MDLDEDLFKIGDGVTAWNALDFAATSLESYIEDLPAAADPEGTMNMAVRADALAAVTDTDGDNIALRATNKGELYVKQTDTVNVNVTGGSISVGATVAVTQSGTWDEVGINDSGNSITVDNPQLSVVGGGAEATALRVTIANDSTGVVSVDDNGGSITVDGTVAVTATNLDIRDLVSTDVVTAELSALDNAVLDAIAASVAAIDTDTTTVIGHLDGVETLLGTIDADTGTLAGAVSGTEMQVDVVAALPAGTNNIGDVDIASIAAGDNVIGRVKLSDGTDVADILDLTNSNPLTVAVVDSNGDQISSFGGGTQYTEDAAAAANPVGTVPILIRTDTPATQVTTDGDNIAQRGTNYGAAYVQVVSSAGAFVDTFGGGTQYTEGDTDATITGTAMLMEGAGNALVVAQGTAADGLLVNLGSNNDVTLAALPAGTNYVGKVRLTDGTLDSNLVDETGASAVDALAVGGGTPHDSVDSGNPIKIGLKALSALPTAVATADRANAISDLWGRQLVSHIDPAMQVSKSFNATTAQTGTDVWDPAASSKIAITSIVIGTYGTTSGRLILWFGDNADTTYTAGTDQLVLAASFAPSATVKPGLVFTPSTPIFCTTADRELHITTDAALSVDIAVYGYEYL